MALCEPGLQPGAVVIHWDTVSGRVYAVYSVSNLLGAWTHAVWQVPCDGGTKGYTNTETEIRPQFSESNCSILRVGQAQRTNVAGPQSVPD